MTRLPLRWRITLALVGLAIGTSLAALLVTGRFLQDTPQVSTNPAIRSALAASLLLAKKDYDARKAALSEAGRSLYGSPELARAFRDGDLDPARRLLASQGLGASTARFDTASAAEPAKPAVTREKGPPERLVLTLPATEDGRGLLIVETPLSDLIQIEEARQTYEHIEMIESGLREGLRMNLVAIGILMVVLAALIGIRIGLGITGPLGALVRGTRELSRDNLNYRIPPGRRDELGLLIDSFNRMAGELEENRRRRVEAEKLAAWREIARRLAHEIKNPLTPIQLTVQQMRDKYSGGDAAYARLLSDCTEIVTEEVESLRTLVQEFAEFARMPRLALSRHGLNDVVRDTLRLYADARLNLDLFPDLPEIELDLEGMRRVVINLIENAIEAAGPDRPISVRSHRVREGVRLDITDQGPGVDRRDRERIFQPYVSSKAKGVGLGLAMVRSIVEEHGGRITVTDAPAGGAQFEILLPVPDAPGPSGPAAQKGASP